MVELTAIYSFMKFALSALVVGEIVAATFKKVSKNPIKVEKTGKQEISLNLNLNISPIHIYHHKED